MGRSKDTETLFGKHSFYMLELLTNCKNTWKRVYKPINKNRTWYSQSPRTLDILIRKNLTRMNNADLYIARTGIK